MADSNNKTMEKEQRIIAESLFELYYFDFLKMSVSILHSVNDAEEAVAHGFFNIVTHIEKIQQLSEGEVFPYCIRIMKNTSMDILRKKHIDVCFDDRTLTEPSELLEMTCESTLRKTIEAIIDSFDVLSANEKEIVRYRFGENMSYSDIAQLMDISEPALRKRIERVRRRMRMLIAENKSNREGDK